MRCHLCYSGLRCDYPLGAGKDVGEGAGCEGQNQNHGRKRA